MLLLTRLADALFGGRPRRLLAGLKINVGGSSGKKQEKFCSARLYFSIDVALVRKMKIDIHGEIYKYKLNNLNISKLINH